MIDAPTEALGGRYHFLAPFRYQDDTPRWLARDERSGEKVVVAFAEKGRLAKLEALKGFASPHLAAIVDIVHQFSRASVPTGFTPGDGALIVVEYISGPTLRRELQSGPINPARAVAWWLRLGEMLAEVHGRGGVIGGISPFSILAKADGRAVPPALTQFAAPLVGATLSPERLKGSAPDASDDVWALYASLYWALTGVAPFPGNTRESLLEDIGAGPPTPLAAFNLKEPELEEILERGLNGDSAARSVDIQELTKSLDAWERGLKLPPRPVRGLAPRSLSGIVKGGLTPPAQMGRVAFDVASLPDEFLPELPNAVRPSSPQAAPRPSQAHAVGERNVAGYAPPVELESSPGIEAPPLPVRANGSSGRASVNPFAKKKTVWPIALGLGLLMGVAVAFYSLNRPAAPESAAPVLASEVKAPKPEVSGDHASSDPVHMTPAQSLNACVMSYFDEGTFAAAAQLGFVCDSGDHREIASRLYELSEAKADLQAKRAVGRAREAPVKPLDGFQVDTVKADAEFERRRRELGWYELLATAIVRKGCCPNAAPVTLPETTGWCEQLQDVVRDLADDSARSGDLAPRVKRFDRAVDCLFANRVRRPYPAYNQEPINEDNRHAFQQFLSHAAVSDAKRRTLGR